MACSDSQDTTCMCDVRLESTDPVNQIAHELKRLNDNLEKLFYRNATSEPPSLSVMLQISPAAIQSLQNLRNKK